MLKIQSQKHFIRRKGNGKAETPYLCSRHFEKTTNMTKEKSRKPLTRGETEVMNILWESTKGMTVREIVDRYPEPQPALTTIGTFLRILEAKTYVEHRRIAGTGRTFVYSPTLSREKYLNQVLGEVRDSFFGRSAKKLCSYFIQHEDLSDEDLCEILELINSNR